MEENTKPGLVFVVRLTLCASVLILLSSFAVFSHRNVSESYQWEYTQSIVQSRYYALTCMMIVVVGMSDAYTHYMMLMTFELACFSPSRSLDVSGACP